MGTGIVVNSYLELYTQFLGWAIYNSIWNTVKSSGLIFIPFIAILWSGWISNIEKSNHESLVNLSFRKIVTHHIIALFVLLLAAEPAIKINPSLVSYMTPKVSVYDLGNVLPEGEVSLKDTGTTYDGAFSLSIEGVEDSVPDLGVPILWTYTLNFSNGFSNALLAGLPQEENLRFLQNFVNSVFIDDPQLANEVSRFTSECYSRARLKFFRIKDEVPTRLNDNLVDDVLERYPNDLNWMGSVILTKSQGLYAKSENMKVVSDGYRARGPVKRFINDSEYSNARPYCDDWWNAIKTDILEVARTGSIVGQGVSDIDILGQIVRNTYDVSMSQYISLDDVIDNYIVETYLKNTRQRLDMVPDDLAWANTSYSSSSDFISESLAYGVKGGLSLYGSAKEGAVWSVKFYTILLALPMLQAVLIFGFIIVLPFLLIFTNFGVKGVIYGFMGFFSLKMLSALWGIASWFDNTLIAAMYPDQSALGAFFSSANNEGTERIILDMITTAMHIGLPMIFFGVIGVAGFQVANVVGGAMEGGSQSAARAGEAGGQHGVQKTEEQIHMR